MKTLSPAQDFVCGSYSGVCATLVGHPFDTAKVRMQTSNVNAAQVLAQLRSGRGFMRSVYKGLVPPLVSVPLANAFVFGGYSSAKHVLVPKDNNRPSLVVLSLCGGWAGFLNSFVCAPVELIRCRLQVDTRSKSRTKSWFSDPHITEIRSIYGKEGGALGFARGLYATIIRDTPGFLVQFFVYEGLKRYVCSENPSGMELVAAGGTAGMIGWLVTYPQDVIKTRLQLDRNYKRGMWTFDGGFWEVGSRIVRKEGGIAVLFRGVAPCLLRAVRTPVTSFAYLFMTTSYFIRFARVGSGQRRGFSCVRAGSRLGASFREPKRRKRLMPSGDIYPKKINCLFNFRGVPCISPFLVGQKGV